MSRSPESTTDADRRGDASIEAERTAVAEFFLDPEEPTDDEEANRPRTGEEFLAHVAHEPN